MFKSKIYAQISYFINKNHKIKVHAYILLSYLVRKNKKFKLLLAFPDRIAFISHIALIMFLIFSACCRVCGHISG